MDRKVITGFTIFLDGSRSTDVDGQLITYDWSLLEKPAGSSLTDEDVADKDMPDPFFTPDAEGKYRFQLIVNDGIEESDPDFVDLYAVTLNIAPNAVAGKDPHALVGRMVSLDGSRSNDPDNLPGILTFRWSFKTLPPGSALDNQDLFDRDQVNPGFIPDVAGTYVIELTVSDGQYSDADQAVVTASMPNTPPNANAGEDQVVALEEEVSLDGTGSADPDLAECVADLPHGLIEQLRSVHERQAYLAEAR